MTMRQCRFFFVPEALSPHTTQYSTSCALLKSPDCPNKRSIDTGSVTIWESNTGNSIESFILTPCRYQDIRWGVILCWYYLYSSRHEGVWRSEDELLCAVAVRWGQDNLACTWAVGCSQNELLLGSCRRLHCCHYLYLLTRLLVCYNLRVLRVEAEDGHRVRWMLRHTSGLKVGWKNRRVTQIERQPQVTCCNVNLFSVVWLLMCQHRSAWAGSSRVKVVVLSIAGWF